MFSLSRPQKAAFVQFVTGSSKVPLGGFAELPGMRGTLLKVDLFVLT